jgi:hypothetical protein
MLAPGASWGAVAMALVDDLVDAALMVKGIRNRLEVPARWPYILSRLRAAVDRVARLEPHRRRQPDADHALDWLHRSIMDAPIAEDQRGEALEVLGGIKVMVGAAPPDWRPSPPPRRKVPTPARL